MWGHALSTAPRHKASTDSPVAASQPCGVPRGLHVVAIPGARRQRQIRVGEASVVAQGRGKHHAERRVAETPSRRWPLAWHHGLRDRSEERHLGLAECQRAATSNR